MSTADEVAKILLKIKAVTINAHKPYQYTSGLLSPVYSDLRLLISYPTERKRIITLLADLVKKVGIPDVFAGTATAGIPHAAWLSERFNLPMIYVRGKPKEHGKQNQIEGLLKKGQTTIIVEDLISTGKSSLVSMNAINSAGGKTHAIIAIHDYALPQSKQNIQEAHIPLFSLTTFPHVVRVAAQEKYMKDKDKSIVLEWLKDSENWGKKMGFE